MKYTDEFWDGFFNQAKQALVEVQAKVPAVSIIQEEQRNPFAVLVSTLLSLRTKDDVTLEASKRILSIAPTPQAMLQLDAGTIEETILPRQRICKKFQRFSFLNTMEKSRQVPKR